MVYVEIHRQYHIKWCIPADSPIQSKFTDDRNRSHASQFISVYNCYKNMFMRHFLKDGSAGNVLFRGHP